jgi:CBS domain-containing protein
MPAGERPVSEVMRRDFVSLNRNDRLDFADEVMRYGRIRHLPVLDHGRVVGIVSNRDLLAASLTRVLSFSRNQRDTFLHSVEVAEVMTKDVCCVVPQTPLAEAAGLMLGRKIGCLVVVDHEDRPVGLVTETDLLRAAYLRAEEAGG